MSIKQFLSPLTPKIDCTNYFSNTSNNYMTGNFYSTATLPVSWTYEETNIFTKWLLLWLRKCDNGAPTDITDKIVAL